MCFQDDLYARKDRIKKVEYGASESQEKKHILILPQISIFNPKLTCIYSQVHHMLIPFFIKMSFKRLEWSPGYDFPPFGNLLDHNGSASNPTFSPPTSVQLSAKFHVVFKALTKPSHILPHWGLGLTLHVSGKAHGARFFLGLSTSSAGGQAWSTNLQTSLSSSAGWWMNGWRQSNGFWKVLFQSERNQLWEVSRHPILSQSISISLLS